MTKSFLIALTTFALTACGGEPESVGSDQGDDKTPELTKVANVTSTCQATWDGSHAYLNGDVACVNFINYRANWWTQGDNPSSHNGPIGSGQPWTPMGPCVATGTSASPKPTPVAKPQPSAPANPAPGCAPAASSSALPWVAPYKDVTISANWNNSVISTVVTGEMLPVLAAAPGLPMTIWAFATGECGQENFGGIQGDALAKANVPTFKELGASYVISTGGAAGSFTCGSDAGFAAFIDRYSGGPLVGIDFDIEAGQSQATIDALVARVKAAQSNPSYKHLRFSFTIATLGGNALQSLGDAGVMVMKSIKAAALQNYVINLMTMDYGSPILSNCVVDTSGLCDMGRSATQAAVNLHNFYNLPYSQIALTPMIGGNDTQNEVFTLNDAKSVLSFAKENKLAGVHFWSFDRDRDCAPSFASPTCNSYGQAGTLGFTKAFLGAPL